MVRRGLRPTVYVSKIRTRSGPQSFPPRPASLGVLRLRYDVWCCVTRWLEVCWDPAASVLFAGLPGEHTSR